MGTLEQKTKTVIVIGAGAAGLMAAYSAAKNGHTVTIYEKNEKAGKKIYITFASKFSEDIVLCLQQAPRKKRT